jgi:hypothetical protein
MYDMPPNSPQLQLGANLFGQLSLAACSEWPWSAYPLKHPELKIAMSEGGIGWVAMLMDRLDNIIDRSGYGLGWDERPADILERNFWFCTIDDPSTIGTRECIGVENIVRGRLPPRLQHLAGQPDRRRGGLGPHSDQGARMMCSENAAKLYRHPLPDAVLPL